MHCVHKRGPFSIDGAGLAVGVSGVPVGVENLKLITPLKLNPAVAPILAVAVGIGGGLPLEVDQNVPERLLRGNITLPRGASRMPLSTFHGARSAVG